MTCGLWKPHVFFIDLTLFNQKYLVMSKIFNTLPQNWWNMDKFYIRQTSSNFNKIMEEIEIKAKPADLPEAIIVDASALKTVEDSIKIADLKLPKGVELADKELDPELAIANVYDPAQEAAEREAEAEADKAAEEARAAEAEAAAAAPAAEEKAE